MLADKLVTYQVTRAQEAEETYALRRQVSTFRSQCQELNRKLEQTDAIISQLKAEVSPVHFINKLAFFRHCKYAEQNIIFVEIHQRRIVLLCSG